MVKKKGKTVHAVVRTHKKAQLAPAETSVSSVTGTQGLSIGIIGCNSQKFMESHKDFINLLSQKISSSGNRTLFFPVSGGSDISSAASQGRHPKQSAGDQPCISMDLSANYGLPARDIVADQIEILIHEEHLDGLVMVPWSINSMVGMLMATVRCGVPTIFLPCYSHWPVFSEADSGRQPPGKSEGHPAVFYGQYSMLLALEVFGLARMGAFEELFSKKEKGGELNGQDFLNSVEWGGQRIVEIAKQKISSRRFFSQASFNNAMCADIALGCSAEVILHLSALAREAGVPLPLSFFNEGAKRVPQLVSMGRSGELSMDDFKKAGGLKALLSVLRSYLQPSPTVVGKNIVEIAKECDASSSGFKLNRLHKEQGGLAVLFGNLAREGTLFRVSGLKEQWLSHSAVAKVFDSEAASVDAILSKKIKKGDAVVIRYCGPRGSPGMPKLNAVMRAIQEKGLEDDIVVITDGRIPLSGRTPAFVHLSPEAASGSTFSVLHDGDVIFWNCAAKTLSVRLTDTEIKVRLSRWKEQEKIMRNGFLYRYSKYSSSSASGAVLS